MLFDTNTPAERVAMISAFVFILVSSFVGNFVTAVVIIRSPKLNSFTDILICNLAISDFVLTVLNLPIMISGYFYKQMGICSCKGRTVVAISCFSLSNWSVFLITFDRFLGVNWPLKLRRKKTKCKLVLAIIAIWVLSICISAFPFAVEGAKDEEDLPVVFTSCIFSDILKPYFVYVLDFGVFLVPWMITFCFYIIVARKVYLSRNGTIRASSTFKSTAKQSEISCERKLSDVCQKAKALVEEIKIAKMICITVTIHTICLLPILCTDILNTFDIDLQLSKLADVALVFVFVTPATNAIIYGSSNVRYRKEFLKYICCKK